MEFQIGGVGRCSEPSDECFQETYLALELADQQTVEDLARLVAVSHVLKGLG